PPPDQIAHGSTHALDRHNADEVLRGVEARPRTWVDRLRRDVFAGFEALFGRARERVESGATSPLRVFVLPGIMGSSLTDRVGHNGLLWIDPLGLSVGGDFDCLRLDPHGARDFDPSIRVEASGAVPIVYDRLSLALIAAFGPVVENVP